MNNIRYHSFDLVRGYAALTVVIAHSTVAGLYKNDLIWPYIEWTPLRFLWAGHQAVIIFFVLSGFALTKMIESSRNYSFPRFLAARFIRLYIPCIASIALVYISFHALSLIGFEWKPGWMGVTKPEFNIQTLAPHLGFIGAYNYYSINPPLWSLVYEARISIIFPIILFIVNRYRTHGVAIFALIDFLCIVLLYKNPQATGYDTTGTILLTGHYSLFFSIGCLLAIKIEQIKNKILSITLKMRTLLFIICVVMYCYPFNNPWSLYQRGIGDIIISVGATGLLILSTSVSEKSMFFKLGIYLGKISFSLYLTHFIVLSTALVTIYRNHGSIYVWLFTIPISILTAHAFTLAVDRPSVALSRVIYRKNKLINSNQENS